MIVVTHPRSGSSAFLRMLQWKISASKQHDNRTGKLVVHNKGTRLAEFLNFGNQGGNLNIIPIIQHFSSAGFREPFKFRYADIDPEVFSLPTDYNFYPAIINFLNPSKRSNWSNNQLNLPTVERHMMFTYETWCHELRILVANLTQNRIKYIKFLHDNRIPFTCKHFLRTGIERVVDRTGTHYKAGLIEDVYKDPDWQNPWDINMSMSDDPLPTLDYTAYDYMYLISSNPARSVMSGAILNNYKLLIKGNAHNYETAPNETVVPLDNLPTIDPNQVMNRLGGILAVYSEIEQNPNATVITNKHLFENNHITHKGHIINFTNYVEPFSGKEIPIPYSNPIEDYHSNSNEIKQIVKDILLTRYPAIVNKYRLEL
jgi:hypothetical protein